MNEIFRFGIIGCGNIAPRHAAQIAERGILAAVCDIIPEKANRLGAEYKATAYYNLNDLLVKEQLLDILVICSPNALHAEHALKGFEHGLHVICEKPLAITVKDAGLMMSASDKSGKHLFAVKQNRFNPPVVAIKKLLNEGRLGKICSFQVNCFWNRGKDYYNNSWRGTRLIDGGTLFTQFSHFIDLLYWMLGDVDQIHAFSGNFLHQGIIEFEDTGVVILKLKSGAIGTINYTVNSHQKNMEGSITLFGEKGTVKVGGEYLNVLDYQQIDGYQIEELVEGNKANEYGYYSGSMSNHDMVYDNVVDVLKGKASFATSAYDAFKTVEIISRIYNELNNINPDFET